MARRPFWLVHDTDSSPIMGIDEGDEMTSAKKAAKWWREALDSGNKGDAQLDGMHQVFFLSRDTGAAGGDLDAFETALEKAVDDVLAERSSVSLSVDYHPDRILSDAAEVAGLNIPMFGWPSKTSMQVSDDKVSVSNGYGAASKEL